MTLRREIIVLPLFLLIWGFYMLSSCQLLKPSFVTPEGVRVYIPNILPGSVILVACDSVPGYSCYVESENDWEISFYYRKFEDDKYWDNFYSLDHQLHLREELFCSHLDRVTDAEYTISASEFEVYGTQTKLNVDGKLEPEKHFFYYEYICPTYRFRCEIGTSYKDLGKYNLKDWADQFKDIRHEIVQ